MSVSLRKTKYIRLDVPNENAGTTEDELSSANNNTNTNTNNKERAREGERERTERDFAVELGGMKDGE